MLFWLIATTLVAQAVAQDYVTIDPNTGDLSTEYQWCQEQMDNCPNFCGGVSQPAYNVCLDSALIHACNCSYGTGPSNIRPIQATLFYSICESAFTQCESSNPGSDTCRTCGTLEPSNVSGVSATTSSPPSTSPTSTTLSSSLARKTPSATNPTAATSVITSSASASTSDTSSTTASSGSSTSYTATSPDRRTTAKIGIGVGVPVGVAVFAGMIFLAYQFGQRKQRTEQDRRSHPTAAMDEGETVMRDGNDTWVGYVPEIHGTEIPIYSHELEASQALSELEGSLGRRRQELP